MSDVPAEELFLVLGILLYYSCSLFKFLCLMLQILEYLTVRQLFIFMSWSLHGT